MNAWGKQDAFLLALAMLMFANWVDGIGLFHVFFIFKDNITVTEEYMTSVYNVDFENVEDFLISIPSTDTRAEMYAIVLPKDGKKNIVEKEMQKFIKSYQKEWTGKTQETMVKNVLTQSYGNYLIYIISNKSETVFSTITGK